MLVLVSVFHSVIVACPLGLSFRDTLVLRVYHRVDVPVCSSERGAVGLSHMLWPWVPGRYLGIRSFPSANLGSNPARIY